VKVYIKIKEFENGNYIFISLKEKNFIDAINSLDE